MIYMIIFCLVTYLICSLSPAIIICKKVKKEDIRKLGSGNAGSTNALRVMGKFFGIVTFLLDAFKVVLSYLIILLICKIFRQDLDSTVNSCFLVSAVVGHCFPIYYSFSGGKGVVALLISMLIINSKVAIVCIIVGIIIILVSRMVSLGSLCGVALLNIMSFVMIPEYIIPIFIVSGIVVFKHRSNIDRLMKKEEKKLF